MGGARATVAIACAVAWTLALGATAAGEAPPDPAVLHEPSAIAEGPGGALWVIDTVGIMRVGRGGRLTRVLEEPGLTSIARGPGGSMWFSEYSPARIGRIASDGAVRYFGEGRISPPRAIAMGRGGNLWFTERKRIGRITPGGAVTEFSAGLFRHSDLADLASGPDGNLWFTDSAGAVGRISPGGTIKEFAVGKVDEEGPGAIAAGPGGLWFAQVDRVGRISIRGRVRFFKTPFYDLSGIARGPGGMWVTGSRNYSGYDPAAVARVTPLGAVKLFTRGLSGYATNDIARARDGSLWAAEDARVEEVPDPVARLRPDGRAAREIPHAPRCHVPKVERYPLLWVDAAMFYAYCTVSSPSRRAGRDGSKVALGTRPGPGAVLPFGRPVKIRFGPVPPLPNHCRLPFGGRRLTSSPTLVAYSYTDYDTEYLESKTHYGACLKPRGRLRSITSSVDELLQYSEASGFKIAGDFVVYAFFDINHYNASSTSLDVYDVRHHRHVLSVGVESHGGDLYDDAPDNPLLGEYVVSAHGAIAWLSHEGATIHLYAKVGSHPRRELDAAPSLSDLAFSGDTLSWTSGSGERKSAEVR